MAKDPAVLLYTSDFLSGTRTMTNEEVGMYILLLCLQHQNGKLTERDMLSICKTYVEAVYTKFELIDGFYVNRRMYEESKKRSKYTESRRNNASAKHMHKHMENENEIVNESINTIEKVKKFIKPELLEVQNHFKTIGYLDEAESFFNYYESNGWKVGKNPMKNWKAASRNWIKNSKNYKKNDTTKTSIDFYNERRNELHRIAEEFDRQRGIRP